MDDEPRESIRLLKAFGYLQFSFCIIEYPRLCLIPWALSFLGPGAGPDDPGGSFPARDIL